MSFFVGLWVWFWVGSCPVPPIEGGNRAPLPNNWCPLVPVVVPAGQGMFREVVPGVVPNTCFWVVPRVVPAHFATKPKPTAAICRCLNAFSNNASRPTSTPADFSNSIA